MINCWLYEKLGYWSLRCLLKIFTKPPSSQSTDKITGPKLWISWKKTVKNIETSSLRNMFVFSVIQILMACKCSRLENDRQSRFLHEYRAWSTTAAITSYFQPCLCFWLAYSSAPKSPFMTEFWLHLSVNFYSATQGGVHNFWQQFRRGFQHAFPNTSQRRQQSLDLGQTNIFLKKTPSFPLFLLHWTETLLTRQPAVT